MKKIFVGVRDQLESKTLALAEFEGGNTDQAGEYYDQMMVKHGGQKHEGRYDVVYAMAADRKGFLRAHPLFGEGCPNCQPKQGETGDGREQG